MADSFEESMDVEMAPGWKPSEGDMLIGKVTGLSKGWSDYTNSYYPIIEVEDEDGNRTSVHAFHMALQSRLRSLKPKVGETIGIKMGPKIPLKSKPTQSVQTYTVKVKGRTEDIWGDISDPRVAAPTAKTAGNASEIEDDDDIPF